MLTKKLMVCIIKSSANEVRIVLLHISVDQLKDKPGEQHDYVFTVPASDLDLSKESEFVEPLTLRLEATYSNGKVLLKGILHTKLSLECSRCLQKFSCLFTTDFEEETDAAGKDILEVGDLVRDAFLIGFPLKPLCQVSCAGLCAECGSNQNETQCDCGSGHIDHRLQVLKKLLEQDK